MGIIADYEEEYIMDEDFNGERIEIPVSPSNIKAMKEKEYYVVDYTENVSNEEFRIIYNRVLRTALNALERQIISLVFDVNGYQILTDDEISEITGINVDKVSRIKTLAIHKLRNNRYMCERKENL